MENILFVCIGNGKIIGDSLGPLIGTVLEKNKRLIQNNVKIDVIGTFENPILYYNVEEFIKNIDSQDYSEIVIIDSALGSKENIGKVMKENNIDESLYSKTLEYVLLNGIYDEKYLNEYKDIIFNDNDNFENIITTFLPKGYTGKEINYIFELSDKNINILKEIDYVDIKKYYKYKNFDVSKINRYNNYKDKTNYSYENVITYVNINIDIPYYETTNQIDNPDDLLVLVNKYFYLPSNYKPKDLDYIDGAYGNKVPIRSVLKEDFLSFQQKAKEEINVTFMPTTAFREESFQKTLYDNYVNNYGTIQADTFSARPGYSEHQTGLAMDLKNISLNSSLRLTDENYAWLEKNAYKYGFIIRYPKNKEFITGYQFENWHIRYVGKDNAKIIYENNLTLEEYIDLYKKTY